MPWIALVMGAFLVLGLVVPRWLLLPVPLIVWFVQWYVDTPPPDDDVARAAYWILLVLYGVPLVVGIAAGRLARWPGKRHAPSDPSGGWGVGE